MKHIYLIGMPGSGKSTVSTVLAPKLNMAVVDMDYEIEKKEGAGIPSIFSKKGESYFRRVESEVLHELTKNQVPHLISTGGGVPCFHDNMELMLAHGIVVYFSLSTTSLYQRLEQKAHDRPLLRGLESDALYDELDSKLKKRSPYYERAHITIFCDNKSVDEIALEAEQKISEQQTKSNCY